MSVIFVLIAFSLIVAIAFLILFLWAVKSGQYEDDYTPSVRILFEDKPVAEASEKEEITDNKNTDNPKTKN